MDNTELPILIVDDAKFSSALVLHTLKSAGYKDIRIANSAHTCLSLFTERPASLLIADWLMPEMDGIQLAGRIRQADETTNQYTYIILLTAKEGAEPLKEAFDHGVDDFINKSMMNQQLIARVLAAERMISQYNRLLSQNQLLIDTNQRLRKFNQVDPLTGLGNRKYSLKRLDDSIRQSNHRGGFACFLLICLDNVAELQKNYDKKIYRQVIFAISRRLQQLVRPLDIVTRITPEHFAITFYEPSSAPSQGSFRRLYEACNSKEVKTDIGYINIKTSLLMVSVDAHNSRPKAESIMKFAAEQLPKAREMQRLVIVPWQY